MESTCSYTDPNHPLYRLPPFFRPILLSAFRPSPQGAASGFLFAMASPQKNLCSREAKPYRLNIYFFGGGTRMARSGDWLQHLADRTGLESEALPGLPILEIAGDRRVLIEHHSGVLEYGPEQIRIRVAYGTVCVVGCGLELVRMSHKQLVIAGRIDSVCLQRRCK